MEAKTAIMPEKPMLRIVTGFDVSKMYHLQFCNKKISQKMLTKNGNYRQLTYKEYARIISDRYYFIDNIKTYYH